MLLGCSQSSALSGGVDGGPTDGGGPLDANGNPIDSAQANDLAQSAPVVIWNLIRRCNLTCKHCYALSADHDYAGELDTAEVFRVIDDLKAAGVRVLILSGGEPEAIITANLLPEEIGSNVPLPVNGGAEHLMSLPLREAREIFEREYLLAQINRFGGNISRTAEFVGMERSALHRKLRALGVSSQERSGEPVRTPA